MKRRHFIKSGIYGSIGSGLLPLQVKTQIPKEAPDAVRVNNGNPQTLLDAALKALGGMNKFIDSGDSVVLKPNMGWDRGPEYAANTNPDLIAALVQSCYNAGAKEVKIFDRTCNNPLRCYKNSGIENSGQSFGAEVQQIRKNKFESIDITNGKEIKKWTIYRDYLEADKIINVPIAKHHSLSQVSLGTKNLMGVMGGNRGSLHTNFDTKLADIASEILPDLTVIDAYRILTGNGPSGGNLSDVKLQKSIIASSCMVTADIIALELFNLSVNMVGHIREMARRRVPAFDRNKLIYREINLS
jgi:uncharacterized protein (DUF362 family)